jgi:hypothetical protein
MKNFYKKTAGMLEPGGLWEWFLDPGGSPAVVIN